MSCSRSRSPTTRIDSDRSACAPPRQLRRRRIRYRLRRRAVGGPTTAPRPLRIEALKTPVQNSGARERAATSRMPCTPAPPSRSQAHVHGSVYRFPKLRNSDCGPNSRALVADRPPVHDSGSAGSGRPPGLCYSESIPGHAAPGPGRAAVTGTGRSSETDS